MFTGIVETIATLVSARQAGTNLIFTLSAVLDAPLKIDQSIAHNGVCLSVSGILSNEMGSPLRYEVSAVEETLRKTNLGELKPGDKVNLERSLKTGDRMEGHFVQGHVDSTGTIETIEDRRGSWNIRLSFDPKFSELVVNKGSVCVNGVSLTVVECGKGWLVITIIPLTFSGTNFHSLAPGNKVNLEYDILGKYIHKMYSETAKSG